MRKTSPHRAATSTVVALLIASLVASFGVSFVGSSNGGGVPAFNAVDTAVWSVILYVYASWATLLLGLPTYFLFRRLDAIRWWSAMLAGVMVGAFVFVVVCADGLDGLLSQPGLALSWAVIGGLAALAFWVVWWRGHGKAVKHEA